MKNYKTLTYLLLTLPLVFLQSCLKDQEDKFSEPASERMEKFLSNAQSTLTASEEGWVLDYFPDDNQLYGGFVYTVKFTKDKATVGCELANDATAELTSLYRMTADNGPVLSFDSGNDFIHYFATPNGEHTKAYGGDFEFVIDSVGTDIVKIHGKRSLNTMYLRKLAKPASLYLAEVKGVQNSFDLTEADGTVNDQKVSLTFEGRRVTFTAGETSVTEAYIFYNEGIRLYQPVTIAGKTFSELKFDAAKLSLTATDADGVVFYNLPTNLVVNDEAFSRNFFAKDLTAVEVKTGGSWLKATKTENGITLAADANTTGHPRAGRVKLTKNGGDSVIIRVTQVEFDKDIAGTYTLAYVDGDNVKSTASATLDRHEGNVRFRWVYQKAAMFTVPVTWDEKTATLSVESGQYWGSISTTDGSTYYVYDILLDKTQRLWTSYNKGVFVNARFNYDEKNNATVARFTGQVGKGEFGSFLLRIFTAKSPTKANDKGTLDLITSPILIRQYGAAPAKAGIAFSYLKAPEVQSSTSLSAVAPLFNSKQ